MDEDIAAKIIIFAELRKTFRHLHLNIYDSLSLSNAPIQNIIRTFASKQTHENKRYGQQRQDNVRLLKLRTGVDKMDRQVPQLRAVEHVQGNQGG